MSFPQEIKGIYKAFITGSGGGVSAHTYDTFPDNDDITNSTHGTADTYGDYTAIVTTVGASPVWTCGIYCSNPTIETDFKVDISSGASGSETRRITVPYARTDKTSPSNDVATVINEGVYYGLPFPIKFPATSQLWSRVKAGATAGAVDVVEHHAASVA